VLGEEILDFVSLACFLNTNLDAVV